MFNPHTKFEVSTITSNKEMKCNAKCENSRFEPPFGWLRGNAQGSPMVDGKRIVDFLSAIIGLFPLALMAAALLSEICQNWRFPMGVGHSERKF